MNADLAGGSPIRRGSATRRPARLRASALVMLLLLLGSLVLAACGGDDDDDGDDATSTTGGSGAATATTPTGGAAASPTAADADDADDDGETPKVTVGLTYIPNVQFAPFYVAIEEGYFADEGVDVELRHHAVGEDQFGALVAGQEHLMMAAGDEVLLARGQGIDLQYVAQVFSEYPVALIVPTDSEIESLEDLAGHSIGIPGEYGSTWHGLLALLGAAGLTRDDVDIQSVGFTQVEALVTGKVDAVMGYANNEPLQIEKAGIEVRTFPVSDAVALISNGMVSLEAWMAENEDTTEAVVAGVLRGLEYVLDNPEGAVEISRKYVPTLLDDQSVSDAQEVLEATLPFWQPQEGQPLGGSNLDDWEAMLTFLQENALLQGEVDVREAWNDSYLPE